jgi:glutaconyl-CoA/methylmalonyl-CoA decarboxylase subunit gamma
MMKTYELKIGGKDYKIDIERFDGKRAAVKVNGKPYEIDVTKAVKSFFPGGVTPPPSTGVSRPTPYTAPQPIPEAPQPLASVPAVATGGRVVAPMPGLILEILVAVGDTVSVGASMIKMEAMKMENDIPASVGGKVKEIRVKKGDRVQTEDILAVIEEG